MFENVLADLRNYRRACCRGRPLWLVAPYVLYAHPASAGVLGYRFGSWAWRLRIPILRPICQFLYSLVWPLIRLYSGVQIQPQTVIGPGLTILHFGGVVITPECVIGPNCLLHHHFNVVTTNNRHGATIGSHFYAGVGVTLIGNIVIEDNVACGAGSVVTRSIPAHAVVAGVPARILRFRDAKADPWKVRVGGHGPAPMMETVAAEV
jgi:serine acetyltransferase